VFSGLGRQLHSHIQHTGVSSFSYHLFSSPSQGLDMLSRYLWDQNTPVQKKEDKKEK